jgi:hypothetical protein
VVALVTLVMLVDQAVAVEQLALAQEQQVKGLQAVLVLEALLVKHMVVVGVEPVQLVEAQFLVLVVVTAVSDTNHLLQALRHTTLVALQGHGKALVAQAVQTVLGI